MNPVRGLIRDLVERRLWPVAILLVVAAVAVPMYLSKSSSSSNETAAVPASPTQTAPKTSKAAVSIDDSATDDTFRGTVRDPFKQRHQAATTPANSSGDSTPAANSGTTTTSGASGSSGGSSSSSGTGSGSGSTDSSGSNDSSGSTGSGSGSTGSDNSSGSGSGTTSSGYHVTLQLGKVGALKTYSNVARLAALPSADNPLFVFTGVLKGGQKIVLLPAYGVSLTPESDIQCKPSNSECEKIELGKDDTIFFTLLNDTSGTTYQLDIKSITGHAAKADSSSSSSSASAAALGRHSKAGAAMLRDAHVTGSSDYKGTSYYRWVPERGYLLRVKHSSARASANGAAAASVADAQAALPGVEVWHSDRP